MAPLNFSYDHNWIRFISLCVSRLLPFRAIQTVRDGRARGFDSILDLFFRPCAGGLFSFWNRRTNPPHRLGRLAHASREPAPSLRSNTRRGQANFVNPGIFLGQLPAAPIFDVIGSPKPGACAQLLIISASMPPNRSSSPAAGSNPPQYR